VAEAPGTCKQSRFVDGQLRPSMITATIVRTSSEQSLAPSNLCDQFRSGDVRRDMRIPHWVRPDGPVTDTNRARWPFPYPRAFISAQPPFPTLQQPVPEAIPVGLPVTVSVEQAALLLGIGRTVAYRLVLAGDLRSVKIGGRRLVVRASIEEYVSRLECDS
jgi:excisionase family DNA binding protein